MHAVSVWIVRYIYAFTATICIDCMHVALVPLPQTSKGQRSFSFSGLAVSSTSFARVHDCSLTQAEAEKLKTHGEHHVRAAAVTFLGKRFTSRHVIIMSVRAVPIRQKLVGDLRMHKRMHADCNMTIYTVFGKKHPLLFSCITLTKC